MKFLLPVFAAICLNSCQTLTPNQEFVVSAGTDLAVALVVANTPEFAPYALAVAEVVKTQDLTPDSLEATLEELLVTQVSPDDQAMVAIVLDVITNNYRLFYERKVAIEPEEYADALAEQLVSDSSSK